MKYSTLVGAAVAAILAAGCDSGSNMTGLTKTPPSRPSFENTVAQDFPWGIIVANTCNGDMVTLTGTSHVVQHSSVDESGGTHYDVSMVSKGSGIGLAPALKEYTGQSNNPESYQFMDPTTSVIVQDILRVVGPKPTDNFYLHFQWKVTVNANGVAVDRVKEPEVRCKG